MIIISIYTIDNPADKVSAGDPNVNDNIESTSATTIIKSPCAIDTAPTVEFALYNGVVIIGLGTVIGTIVLKIEAKTGDVATLSLDGALNTVNV